VRETRVDGLGGLSRKLTRGGIDEVWHLLVNRHGSSSFDIVATQMWRPRSCSLDTNDGGIYTYGRFILRGITLQTALFSDLGARGLSKADGTLALDDTTTATQLYDL
jgi:hypothetical protein